MSVYAVVRRLISSAMIVSVHAVVSVTSNGTNTQSEEVIMSRYRYCIDTTLILL